MKSSPPNSANVTRLCRTPGAARIRQLICAAGLTQAEAGALIGVGERRIRRFLNGDGIDAAELICKLEALLAEKRRAA